MKVGSWHVLLLLLRIRSTLFPIHTLTKSSLTLLHARGLLRCLFRAKTLLGHFFKNISFSFSLAASEDVSQDLLNVLGKRAALEHIVKEIQEVLKTNKFKKRHKRRILKLCDKLSAKSVCGGIVLSLLYTFCKVGTKGKVIRIGQYFG